MSTYDSPDGIAVARELIPARARKAIYATASLAGYALAAVAVGLTTAAQPVPSAVTVSMAVLGALTGPLGQLAATNVSTAPAALPADADEGDDAEPLPDGGFAPDDDEDEPTDEAPPEDPVVAP